ncbi:conserved hypothetical protein [Crenothrix polyspora]|uniref:Uncharacterized protein n=1 Tax=Crenothrix polyspora TaxID=360316 RepID=A0A1R4H6W5_9GAMM|nr:conserved hypothetical protein [Crenothrix polyspora]
MLEQLARDVTQWDARAVEFFQVLATTQYMNHLRPMNHYSPDLRRWEPLTRIGHAFDSCAHTVDVRRIESKKGKYNIPNIGIFLWRLDAYRHTSSPAVKLDDTRWFISPLGHPLQLFNHPLPETQITHLAEPVNVPESITRRMLHEYLKRYYGSAEDRNSSDASINKVDNSEPSIVLYIDDAEVPRSKIMACDLSDSGANNWAHLPKAGFYAIDPVLGRVACGSKPKTVKLTYHRGFSADLGGGEYSRELLKDSEAKIILQVPKDYPTIQGALDALKGGNGIVKILDSGRYEEALNVSVLAGQHITVFAKDGCFPTIVLPIKGELTVSGGKNSLFVLDGVMLTANRKLSLADQKPLRLLHVPSDSGALKLVIRHCTLVPGLALDVKGMPLFPNKPAVHVEADGIQVVLERAIVGALYLHAGTQFSASDSIIDATTPDRAALVGSIGSGAGGVLSLDACTVIGKIHMREVGEISNSLLVAHQATGDTDVPVHIDRRQAGCVRFSYVPLDSRVPKRYRCQPEDKGNPDLALSFVSLRFGVASYCQLALSTSDLIRSGADDESEMGAFHLLFPAQREANLRIRLREFMRVGLEAGIFYET